MVLQNRRQAALPQDRPLGVQREDPVKVEEDWEEILQPAQGVPARRLRAVRRWQEGNDRMQALRLRREVIVHP